MSRVPAPVLAEGPSPAHPAICTSILFLAVLVSTAAAWNCGSESGPKDQGVPTDGGPGDGCGPDSTKNIPEIPNGCNPLAYEWDCLVPFPSDYFLVEDPAMPGGKRLSVEGRARLIRDDGEEVAPQRTHPADGFAVNPIILAYFPRGVDTGNLPSPEEGYDASLSLDSPTLLIEADTGVRVPHFAEVDRHAGVDTRQALIIHPFVRLKNETRYVVGIRGLKDRQGRYLDAPEGFRLIRDNQAACHQLLGPMARRYSRDVFPVLEGAGAGRDTVLLAWDFTTESRENVTGDMFKMRDVLAGRLKATPPSVSIEEIIEAPNEHVYRLINGSMQVPLFLDSTGQGYSLCRDSDGGLCVNGSVSVPFSISIPHSMAGWTPADPPARVVQYGHGFFGGRDEIGREWLVDFADSHKFIVVTTDWWGMAKGDLGEFIGNIVSAPSEMLLFTNRLHQGMANFIAMTYALKGPLREQEVLQKNGVPLYEKEDIYYYGNSQGGILGGTYAALSPSIKRFVLGVGGASYNILMFRSEEFADFLSLMQSLVSDPLDVQKWGALLQTGFDRIDPVTYAPFVPTGPAGDASGRRVLMHVGIGDTAVSNLTSHLLARTVGADLPEPCVRDVPGLEHAFFPHDGSAIIEFDFGQGASGVHGGVRKLEAAALQIDRFFSPDGRIEQTCNDVCDPE